MGRLGPSHAHRHPAPGRGRRAEGGQGHRWPARARFWPWADLYVDALVLTGRLEQAEQLLAGHEDRARAAGHRGTVARLSYPRARLHSARGELLEAKAVLLDGLAQLRSTPLAYERARLQFVQGQTLRRAGKRREAEQVLQEARNTFSSMGSQLDVSRCETEVKAGGLRPRRDARDVVDLTPQEHTVARLVAAGKSDREVAVELSCRSRPSSAT